MSNRLVLLFKKHFYFDGENNVIWCNIKNVKVFFLEEARQVMDLEPGDQSLHDLDWNYLRCLISAPPGVWFTLMLLWN